MLHTLFSRYLGLPLLDLQQSVRPSRRPVALARDRGLKFRNEAERWTEEQKRHWILEQLRTTVRAANDTVYYADLFRRIGFDPFVDFGFAEFAKIPVLERDAIRTASNELIPDRVLQNRLRNQMTGGSTGQPVRIKLGPGEEGWSDSGREFFLEQVGIRRGARIAYLWGHHLDPTRQDSALQKLLSFVGNECWFDSFRLSPDVLRLYHQELESKAPECMVAYATALGHLAQFLSERKIRPSYPRKCIITGAEKLFAPQREIVERVFQCPVYERYGSREVGLIGFQLGIPESSEFVVDWANLLVEREDSEARSSILITKLHADGTMMIRYRVGDSGEFSASDKPGHPSFQLLSVAGRVVDHIVLQNGDHVDGLQFPHMMKDFPVQEFMVIQQQDYSVSVEIVPGPAFREEHRDAILSIMRKNLPGLSIRVIQVATIAKTKANKWRPVISHVAGRPKQLS